MEHENHGDLIYLLVNFVVVVSLVLFEGIVMGLMGYQLDGVLRKLETFYLRLYYVLGFLGFYNFWILFIIIRLLIIFRNWCMTVL